MYTYVGTSATITLLPHNRCRPSHLRRRRRRGAPSSVCCPPLSFLSYAHCFITTDTVHCFLQLCTKQAPAKNTVPFYAGCASILVLHTYIYIPTPPLYLLLLRIFTTMYPVVKAFTHKKRFFFCALLNDSSNH